MSYPARAATDACGDRSCRRRACSLRQAARRLRTGGVDDLGDVDEVDRRRDAVETGDPVAELAEEDLVGGLVRVPRVEVDGSLLLLVDREDFERSPGIPS